MMFVTDLTAFAENGFYGIDEAIYRCMCEVRFSIKIARGQSFHVKCDECGQIGVVKTSSDDYMTKAGRMLLEPIFILEGMELTDLK